LERSSLSYDELKTELDTGWPPPLDAVQEFFEDMWNYIAEVGQNIIDGVVDLAAEFFRRVYDAIFGWFTSVFGDAYFEAYGYLYNVPSPARQILALMLIPSIWLKDMVVNNLTATITHVYELLPEWLRKFFEDVKVFTDNIKTAAQEFFRDPVAALQEGFNGVVTSVVKAFHDIFDPIADSFAKGFEELRNTVTDTINNFIEELKKIPTNIGKALGDALTSFWNWLRENPSHVMEVLNPAYAAYMEILKKVAPEYGAQIESSFTNSFEWLLKNLVNGFTSIAAWMDKNVLTPIWNKVVEVGKWIIDSIRNMFNNMINKVKAVSEDLKRGNIKSLVEFLASIGSLGLGATAITSVMGIKVMGSGIQVGELGSYVKDFINPGMITGATMGILLAQGISEPARQYFNSIFRPTLPDLDAVRMWYLRGFMNDTEVKDVLARYGYVDDYINNYIKSWEVIPGIRDLIEFTVKEIMKPEEFYDWAKKQGLNEYWAKNYWEAHWRMPSFEQLQRAYWRGIITEDEFKKYVVWWDYKPEPRPGISKSDLDIMAALSYDLPGKIDARWMLRWGIINKSDMVNLLRMNGLHPDWLDKVAEAEYLNQLLDERTRVKSEYYASYRDGFISREALEAKLREVKFIDDEIKFLLDAADEAKRRELLDITLDYYKELFKRGKITKTEFINDLTSLGLDADYIKRMADTLELKYTRIERVDLTKDERNSVRSSLIKLFKEGLVSEDELRQKLMELGYSDDEIELTIQHAELEYKYDLYMDYKRMLIEAFRKGNITRDEFKEYLIQYGLSEERAETIVTYEELRLLPKPKPPS